MYQIPERAVSNNVELVTLTSLQYHNGYFHLKIVSLISIFLLSFNGDSPSAKIESSIFRLLLLKSALSPLKYFCLIISIFFSISIFHKANYQISCTHNLIYITCIIYLTNSRILILR